MIDESVVKLFTTSLDLESISNEEQLKFWVNMKKYLQHGRSFTYLTNNLEELIKFLNSINCTNQEIITILTNAPSLLNSVSDLYNKYIFLGVLENSNNSLRKDKLLNKTIEYRVSLKKIYQRYCLIKEVNYPNLNWNILVHATDKEFANVFICRTYKKHYQLFSSENEVYQYLTKYSLDDLDIDIFKSLDVNRELVEHYEIKSRR